MTAGPAGLVVIRHGLAEGNQTHRFIGWSDAPLDPEGREQAKLVASRLADAGIDRIAASDLLRAQQTAEPLAEVLGLDIETDPRLREIDNGEWTGLLPQEIEDGWPDLWTGYVTGTDVDRPGGERWGDVRSRVVEALRALIAAQQTVAVFTHAGPVVLAAAWALDIPLPGNIFRGPLASPANASLTTISPGPRLVGYSDVGHLMAVPRVEIPYGRVG